MSIYANAPFQSGDQAQNWPVQDRRQRALAALLSVLICLGLLQQLNRQSGGKWKRLAIEASPSVMALQFIPVRPPTVPERAPPKVNPGTKPLIQTRRPTLAPPEPEIREASESNKTIAPAAGIESAEPLSSLRFDREAIARAYTESKSDIQKMAEASGKDRIMEIGPPGKSERYQAAIAQGYKPDCVSKSTGGAGLLAIPLIGYLIATDKCNFRK